MARATEPRSVTDPTMSRNASEPARCARLSADPVDRSSIATTDQPPRTRYSARCDPMNPAPPVTSARMSPPGQPSNQPGEGVAEERQWIVPCQCIEPHRPAVQAQQAPKHLPLLTRANEMQEVAILRNPQ